FFFFFSSRRRHTRFSRDWSSDVCSSDLSRRRDFRSSLLSAKATCWCEKAFELSSNVKTCVIQVRGRHHEPVGFLRSERRWLSGRSEERRVGKECRWRWWMGE